MGLFSSKIEISVASVTYNLAGALEDRTSFLKTTVARAVLNPSKNTSLGSEIVAAQLEGPSFQQRRFFSWANQNYSQGELRGQISNRYNVNADMVHRHIPVPTGERLFMMGAHIDSGEYVYWAEKFLLENHPDRYVEPWTCDLDNRTNVVTIQYADDTEESFTLGEDYDPEAEYIFGYYTTSESTNEGQRSDQGLISGPNKPETTGFTTDTSQEYSEDILLRQKVITSVSVAGAQPEVTETITTQLETYHGVEERHTREVITRTTNNGLRVTKNTFRLWFRSRPEVVETSTIETVTSGNTVTEIETITQSLETIWDHRLITHTGVVIDNTQGRQNIFMYKLGSGIRELDRLRVKGPVIPEFFPVIPLRLNNKSIRHDDFEDDFPDYKKAFKKAIGGDINELLDELEDHDQIDDIDYSFLVHGVELNTKERHGRRYIYEFLKSLIQHQNSSVAEIVEWINETRREHETFIGEVQPWQVDNYAGGGDNFGGPRPQYLNRQLPNTSSVVIKTLNKNKLNYQTTLSWLAIGEGIDSGLGKPDAKPGDLWFDTSASDVSITHLPVEQFWGIPQDMLARIEHVRLYWQHEEGSHRYLDIYGFLHENVVYKGETVKISAKEALEDEDESGFILPLHRPTMVRMPAVAANDLANSARLIVFNCYEERKIRWYQRGIFRFLFAIVLSLVFAPLGVGLLGSNLAVGMALGLSNFMAILVGAIANTLAAMVLTTVIEAGATAIFGEKFGSIIGAIISFFTFRFVQSFHMTGTFSFNFAEMLKVENLLRLTNSVAGAIQNWAAAELRNIGEMYNDAYNQYRETLRDIERKISELMGYSGVHLDPLEFLDMQDSSLIAVESSATFLERTLLTGTEIADLSFSMIGDYVEINLELPKAYT